MSLVIDLIVNACPHCGRFGTASSFNLTHNLVPMAKEAGIYELLWSPGEIGISKASQLIEPIRKAISDMEADPERFRKHNPPNGWGTYDDFLSFLGELEADCGDWPDAQVIVSG